MALRLDFLKNTYSLYNQNAYPLVFVFLVMIYHIINDKKNTRSLLIYEIFGILLLVTPFIGDKIVGLGAVNEPNWQAYGILCVIPVTAYAAVDIGKQISAPGQRGIFFVLFFAIVQLGMGFSITGGNFALPRNVQKISGTTLELIQVLEADTDLRVMAPLEVAGEIRESSSDISVFYTQDYEELEQDLQTLQSKADDYGYNRVIVEETYNDEATMAEGGFDRIACVDNYVVYAKD